MSRAQPLVTPEELQCLLGGAPARASGLRASLHKASSWQHVQTLHVGAALWLLKGIFLYAVLISPEASQLVGNTRYLWLRGSLELACLAIFWGAALHPRGRTVASASMLVASTTALMDALNLLAFTG